MSHDYFKPIRVLYFSMALKCHSKIYLDLKLRFLGGKERCLCNKLFDALNPIPKRHVVLL